MQDRPPKRTVWYSTWKPEQMPPPAFLRRIPLFSEPEKLQDFHYSMLWATHADELKTIPADEGEDPVWGQLAAELATRLADNRPVLSLLADDSTYSPTAPNFAETNNCQQLPALELSFREQLSLWFYGGSIPLRDPIWLTECPPLNIPDFHLQVEMSLCPVADAYPLVKQQLLENGLNRFSSHELSSCQFILCPDFCLAPFDVEAGIVVLHRPALNSRVEEAVETVTQMLALRLKRYVRHPKT
jgi:hypothetical protein